VPDHNAVRISSQFALPSGVSSRTTIYSIALQRYNLQNISKPEKQIALYVTNMEQIDSQIQLFLEMTNLPEHYIVSVIVDAMAMNADCSYLPSKNLIPHLSFSFNRWIADTAACLYTLCDMSQGRLLWMFRLRLPRFAKLSGGTKLS
jgi:hypothetical protein